MKIKYLVFMILFTLSTTAPAAPAASIEKTPVQNTPGTQQQALPAPPAGPARIPMAGNPDQLQGYRIDQPGTITFTVGVQIKGKVEKPQVVIFLPKERSLYREVTFVRSFNKEIMQPLPFTPVTK